MMTKVKMRMATVMDDPSLRVIQVWRWIGNKD
jgi:hypothetical protein